MDYFRDIKLLRRGKVDDKHLVHDSKPFPLHADIELQQQGSHP